MRAIITALLLGGCTTFAELLPPLPGERFVLRAEDGGVSGVVLIACPQNGGESEMSEAVKALAPQVAVVTAIGAGSYARLEVDACRR